MKRAIVTLVIATALGTVAGHAQEKLKAASTTPPPGAQKELPVAGAAQIPEMPGLTNAPVKVGDGAVVKPGTTTQSKARQ